MTATYWPGSSTLCLAACSDISQFFPYWKAVILFPLNNNH